MVFMAPVGGALQLLPMARTIVLAGVLRVLSSVSSPSPEVASAPIPKFASHCGTSVCELRNQRCTSNLLIPSAAFEFEVPKCVCGEWDRNFKFAALAGERQPDDVADHAEWPGADVLAPEIVGARHGGLAEGQQRIGGDVV